MQAKVSFTQKVKEELTTLSFSDEHMRALLSAFIRINGLLSYHDGGSRIILRTENAKIAKFIYHSIDRLYGIVPKFAYSKTMNFKKKLSYSVIVEEGEYLVGDLEINFLDGKIAKNIVSNDDMISGYVAGAFLVSGSVNTPKNSNYHLEVALNNENYAKWFSKLLLRYKGTEFSPKVIKRRNSYVVYLKKAQQVVDFLSMMGATNSTLEFENIRIDREFSSIGNRLQNLDSANYSKITDAADKQISDIKVIENTIGIARVSNEKQRELMKIRLEHDDYSLLELANELSTVLNKPISKSSVRRLFISIHELANKLRK